MERSFAQKLGVAGKMQIYLESVPDDYFIKTELKSSDVDLQLKADQYDFVHIFKSKEQELITSLEQIVPRLKKDGLLWISWPKKSSSITSDLDKMKVMGIGLAAGLVDVKILSYNTDWSSLKFVYRLKDR